MYSTSSYHDATRKKRHIFDGNSTPHAKLIADFSANLALLSLPILDKIYTLLRAILPSLLGVAGGDSENQHDFTVLQPLSTDRKLARKNLYATENAQSYHNVRARREAATTICESPELTNKTREMFFSAQEICQKAPQYYSVISSYLFNLVVATDRLDEERAQEKNKNRGSPPFTIPACGMRCDIAGQEGGETAVVRSRRA